MLLCTKGTLPRAPELTGQRRQWEPSSVLVRT